MPRTSAAATPARVAHWVSVEALLGLARSSIVGPDGSEDESSDGTPGGLFKRFRGITVTRSRIALTTTSVVVTATASTNGFPAGTMTPVGPKLAPTRVRSLVVIDTFHRLHRLRQVAIPGDESKLMTEDATVVVPVT